MGGAGFGQGLASGLQQAQDRAMQVAQLKLQQQFAQAQQKSMETEDQLKQLQLQSLTRRIEAEQRLPSQMAGVLGPQAGEMAPGAQGPTLEGRPSAIDRQKLFSVLSATHQAGGDWRNVLDMMVLGDPTGEIAAIQHEFDPAELVKLAPGEQLFPVKKPRGGLKPRMTTQPEQDVTPDSVQQQGEQDQIAQLRSLTEADAQAGEPHAQGQLGTMEMFQRPTGPPRRPIVPAKESLGQQSQGSIRPIAQGSQKPATVDETKVIAELADLFPEKMATLVQHLGRSPSFMEAGQFFSPSEFAQSLRAREERVREGQIEVAKQTGVAAAERQFELAQKKEKLPQKPTAGERHDFSTDLAALEQARGIIDRFNPQFVGPYKGRYGNIREMIGKLGYDEAEFRGTVARTRNATIKAITGAQMGEREADRIKQELPEFHLSPEAFIARMRLTYANLYDMARIRRKIAGETGVDISGLAPLVPPEEIDPQIREALRKEGGVTPIGAAQEKMHQGQSKQIEQDFIKSLTPDSQKKYKQLSPSDQTKFRERYQQKLQSLPQGVH